MRGRYSFVVIVCVGLLLAIGGYVIYRPKKQDIKPPAREPAKQAPNPQLAVQVGHTERINCVAFSPDGKFVASGDSIGLVILWDVAGGSEIREFVGHASPVNTLAFSSDGRYLITGSGDQETQDERLARVDTTVRMWDVFTGAELHRFTHHAQPVTSVQFSKDNQKILSASLDGVAKVVDVKTDAVLQTLGSATQPVNVARFSPDGNFVVLASGADDAESIKKNQGRFGVQVWEISTSKLAYQLGAPRGLIRRPIGNLAFSSDGRYLATGGKNPGIAGSIDSSEGVRLWDFENRKLLKTWKATERDNAPMLFGPVSFSTADASTLVTGGATSLADEEVLSTFELNIQNEALTRFQTGNELKGKSRRDLAFESGITTALDVSVDQGLVVVATNALPGGGTNGEESGETSLRIFDLKEKTELRELTGNKTRLSQIQMSPDGRMLSAFRERTWPYPSVDRAGGFIWDTRVGSQINLSNFVGSRSSRELLLANSTDGALAITQAEQHATLWDVATQNIIKTLPPAKAAWFSADHSKVLTWGVFDISEDDSVLGKPDTRIALWETKKGGELWHTDYNRDHGSMAYHRDVGSSPIHFDCALSPDGKYVAFNDDAVTLLDGRTGAFVNKLAFTQFEHSEGLLTFSTDSKYLLIGLPDDLVAVDVISGRPRWKLGAHITTKLDFAGGLLAFSPDGKYVAVAGAAYPRDDPSSDKLKEVIKVIEVDSGKEFWEIDQASSAFVFSSDSRELITIDAAGLQLSLWDVQSRSLIKTIAGAANDRIVSVAFGKDSQIILTGCLGGKVRLIDKKTGTELCTLVSFPDGTWVVVTSDGRFDTNNLEIIQGLHWVFPEEPMKLLPLEIFLRQYYEPQLLVKILEHKQLQTVPPVGSLNRTQPKIEIKELTDPDSEGRVRVTVAASSVTSSSQRDENGRFLESGVYDVRLFRDGQLVGYSMPATGSGSPDTDERDDLGSWQKGNRVPLSDGRYEQTFLVQLPHNADLKRVEFSSYGFNSDRVKSETARAVLTLNTPLVTRRGRAYVIAVGVNACETERWDLSFAASDARVVKNEVTSALWATQEFEKVVGLSLVSDYASTDDSSNELRVKHKILPRTITEASATKRNLKHVFERLAGKPNIESVNLNDVDTLPAVNPDDMVVIYFSGHGLTDSRGNFYLLPYDVGQVNEGSGENLSDDVLKRFISSNELSEWMKDIDAGEIVLLLDACFAAASVESGGFKPGPLGSRGLGQLAYDKGMKILVASQANETALDSGDLKQGLLTYCLVREGIKAGQADYKPQNQVISLDEWLTYAVIRVPKVFEELTKGYVQTAGDNAKRAVVIGASKATGPASSPSQQASLFDFKRKNRPLTIARVGPH